MICLLNPRLSQMYGQYKNNRCIPATFTGNIRYTKYEKYTIVQFEVIIKHKELINYGKIKNYLIKFLPLKPKSKMVTKYLYLDCDNFIFYQEPEIIIVNCKHQ